jgi:hypothetical protein
MSGDLGWQIISHDISSNFCAAASPEILFQCNSITHGSDAAASKLIGLYGQET